MAVELRSYPDWNLLLPELADLVTARLEEGVQQRGRASMVCSGGTTPGALYDLLSERPLQWDRVQVTGSDERWLPPDHPDSLHHLLGARLFRGEAAAASYVPLKTDDPEPAQGEAEVDARLAAMPRPFDLTLLGMGADAHTASLFPHAPGLAEALDLDDSALARAARAPPTVTSPARMTLTLRALLESRLIVLLMRGADKLPVFEAARVSDDPLAAPVSAVLRQDRVPVLAYWAP